MKKEQYQQMREFARTLTEKRSQIPDGQLLDECQRHLDALLEHVSLNFEDYPVDAAAESVEEDLPTGMLEEPHVPEPPPPPVHSEPEPEVRHHETHQKAVAHKRATPRKTHR